MCIGCIGYRACMFECANAAQVFLSLIESHYSFVSSACWTSRFINILKTEIKIKNKYTCSTVEKRTVGHENSSVRITHLLSEKSCSGLETTNIYNIQYSIFHCVVCDLCDVCMLLKYGFGFHVCINMHFQHVWNSSLFFQLFAHNFDSNFFFPILLYTYQYNCYIHAMHHLIHLFKSSWEIWLDMSSCHCRFLIEKELYKIKIL